MTYRSCPCCRTVLSADIKFCSNCGTALPAISDAEMRRSQSSKAMLYLGIGIGAGAVVMLALVLLLRGTLFPTQGSGTTYASSQAAGVETPAPVWMNNVLMSDPAQGETLNEKYVSTVLGSDLTRTQVSSITVLDTLAACPDSAWDVSERQDGSVMAWAQANGEWYDLYLAGEGGVTAPEDCSLLFACYENVTSIRFNGSFHTEHTTNMNGMFSSDYRLETVDVDGFDTGSVTDMGSLFSSCKALTALELEGWDTSRVTSMESMFYHCAKLSGLDVSGFQTNRVIDMKNMFFGCEALTQLDVGGFDTSSVNSITGMFHGCSGLTELDVSGFDISSAEDISWMFYGCKGLSTLDVSQWDVSHVTRADSIFEKCAFQEAPQFSSASPQTGAPVLPGSGTASVSDSPILPDPDSFFHGKLVRDRDMTSDTGGLIHFSTNYDHTAFEEYVDYLTGGEFPIELVNTTTNSVYDYFFCNYTGNGSVEKATSGGGLSTYDLVVVITHIEGIDKRQLCIYYGNGFVFADMGVRCQDTSFEDLSNGDTLTGHFTPNGGSTSNGGSSVPSSDPSSRPISCSFCNGSGQKTCSSCDGAGKERHYESGGGYDGVGPGTWVLETCTTCHGKGTVRCTACQGDGIANN